MTLASGTKLGPYDIISPLGAGGMGEVYRALDTRLGRDVAVKVLPSSISNDSDRVRRFEQEARTVATLNHPNILAIFDVGSQDGVSFLVSELLEGQTLREKLRSGAMPPRRAAELALQLAQGLAGAHSKGIVHRDLKPENIFITRDNRLKILDFGLAKLRPLGIPSEPAKTAGSGEVLTTPGVVMGTIGYMAPEQVRGEAADHRADIFAFGAVFYEMLSGQRAFKRDTTAETLTAILKDDPPELGNVASAEQVSPAMERIVRRCLEKQPDLRFQSASDLGFAVEAISVASGSSHAITRADAHGRSRFLPWLVATAGVIGVAIIAVFAKHNVAAAPPTFQRLTFAQHNIAYARFAPDGHTIFFTAKRGNNPPSIYSTTSDFPEARAVNLPAAVLWAVSKHNEMAVCVGSEAVKSLPHEVCHGTLAEVPMAGGQPREIVEDVEAADWDPQGSKLAIVHSLAGKQQIEYPIGHVLFTSSGWLNGLRFSPDGKKLAFMSHPFWPDDRGVVAVVDLNGTSSILTADSPSEDGLAWSPAGTEIWFTAADQGNNQNLYGVTLKGAMRLIATIPGSIRIHDIAPDGQVLITRDERRMEIKAQLAGDNQEKEYDWLDWSLVQDLSPDGKLLLFGEEGDGGGPRYSSVLWRAGDPSPIRLGEGAPYALSPDGKTVVSVVPGTPAKLVLLPVGPGEPREIPNNGIEQFLAADWTPDGKKLLIGGNIPGKAGRVYLLDLDHHPDAMTPITPESVTIQFGSHTVSPDGASLLARAPRGPWSLYPLDGKTAARAVPSIHPNEAALRWTADGHSVLVAEFGLGMNVSVYKVNLSTDERSLLRTVTGGGPMVIASDGKAYAHSVVTGSAELYLMQRVH